LLTEEKKETIKGQSTKKMQIRINSDTNFSMGGKVKGQVAARRTKVHGDPPVLRKNPKTREWERKTL